MLYIFLEVVFTSSKINLASFPGSPPLWNVIIETEAKRAWYLLTRVSSNKGRTVGSKGLIVCGAYLGGFRTATRVKAPGE